jgi:hypothetical protein
VLRQHLGQAVAEIEKTGGERGLGIGPDLAVGDMAQPVSLGRDDAPAGASKPRIEADDDQESRSNTASETS